MDGEKYGALNRETWRDDIQQGFDEAFRVLRPHGTLIFKWNETQVPVSQVIALTDHKPTIWQRTGKSDKTHWILFLKEPPSTAASVAAPDDLVMLIRQLVRSLKKSSPDHMLVTSVPGYMTRMGYWKVSDCLRTSAPTEPEEPCTK